MSNQQLQDTNEQYKYNNRITWNERHLPEINSGAFNNYFYAPAI